MFKKVLSRVLFIIRQVMYNYEWYSNLIDLKNSVSLFLIEWMSIKYIPNRKPYYNNM